MSSNPALQVKTTYVFYYKFITLLQKQNLHFMFSYLRSSSIVTHHIYTGKPRETGKLIKSWTLLIQSKMELAFSLLTKESAGSFYLLWPRTQSFI